MSNSSEQLQRITVKHIDLARDFSAVLGPRLEKDGPFSGQVFLVRHLRPAYRNNDRVVVALDGLRSYTASFFEEAFGGLVREFGREVFERVQFDAVRYRFLVPQIEIWMREALAEYEKNHR